MKDTSNSAFPHKFEIKAGCPIKVDGVSKGVQQQSESFIQCGMSMRDYFAAAALTGLLSSNLKEVIAIGTKEPNDNKRLAQASYSLADAMLAERAK